MCCHRFRNCPFLIMLMLTLLMAEGPTSSAQRSVAHESLSLSPDKWILHYSPGVAAKLDAAPGGGFTFNFPHETEICPSLSCPSVGYITTSSPALLSNESITATVAISTGGNPRWNYIVHGRDNNGPGAAANCRLFFQEIGDNFSGQGKYQFYRWWSNPATIQLQGGIYTSTVALTPQNWSSVVGIFGNASAAAQRAFARALSNAGNIGMTCGGGSFFGHGVNIIGGTASFTVSDYSIIVSNARH